MMRQNKYPYRMKHRKSGIVHKSKDKKYPLTSNIAGDTACGMVLDNNNFNFWNFIRVEDDAPVTCARCRLAHD